MGDQRSEDEGGAPEAAAAEAAAAPHGPARSTAAGAQGAAAGPGAVAPFDADDWERRLIEVCSVHWPKDPSIELSGLMAERDRLEAEGLWQLDEDQEPGNPKTTNWLWRFEGARRKAGLERMRAGAEAWNAWAAALKELRHALEQAGQWNGDANTEDRNRPTRRWRMLTFADFDELVLDEDAAFNDFKFPGDARFGGATFGGDAGFDGATFGGPAGFGGATFGGPAGFYGATFGGPAGFYGATFGGTQASRESTIFNAVRFYQGVDFTQATWWGPVDFTDARFGFEGAAEGQARATFTSAKSHVSFILTRARFAEVPELHEAEFHDPPRLDNLRVAEPLGTGRLPLVAKRLAQALTSGYPAGPDFTDLDARRDALRNALRPYQLTLGARYDSDPAFEALIGDLAAAMPAQLCIACPNDRAEHARLAVHRAGLARWLETAVLANVQDARFANWGMASDADVSARFRRLRKLARDAGDGDRELDFHAQELKSRRFWLDKPFERQSAARFWLGLAYEKVSDYGRSVARPLAWWCVVALIAFSAFGLVASLSRPSAPAPVTAGVEMPGRWFVRPWEPVGAALGHLLPPAECHPSYLASLDERSRADPPAPWAQAAYLSLKNALVFIDWDRAEVAQRVFGCLYGVSKNDDKQAISPLTPDIPTGLSFIATFQNICSVVLIFLALLGARNLLKIRG